MDLSAISGLTGVGALNAVGAGSEVSAASLTGMLTEKNEKADGTLFSAIFNSRWIILKPQTAIFQMRKMRKSSLLLGKQRIPMI